MDEGNNFRKKNLKKMSDILRQWPLSLHRKTAILLNMALILRILKILQKYKFLELFSQSETALFNPVFSLLFLLFSSS